MLLRHARVVALALACLGLHLLLAPQPGSADSEFVTLNNGVRMPRISLGTCCGSDPGVGLAPWLGAGGTGIDTAFDYSDQNKIRSVLAGKNRSSLFITTKVPAGFGNASDCSVDPDVALRYVRENLLELGTSYVDLVLLHAPCELNKAAKDPSAANEALWKGLQKALGLKLTRAIGVSNYKVANLEALDTSKVVPAVNQCELSIMGSFGQPGQDTATMEYCVKHGIQYESYGALKGCPWKDPIAAKISEKYGKSLAQICLRWVLQRGAVVAAGTGANASTVAAYAKENLGIFDFQLSDADMGYLNALSHPHA